MFWRFAISTTIGTLFWYENFRTSKLAQQETVQGLSLPQIIRAVRESLCSILASFFISVNIKFTMDNLWQIYYKIHDGHNQHIFRPPTLLKMLFRRKKALILVRISSSNFVSFRRVEIF